MHIRDYDQSDLPTLINLTIEAFRPLFEQHLPGQMTPAVFDHDHGQWESNYRAEVPSLYDPDQNRFVTLAELDGDVAGYVGWNVSSGDTGRLEMVAVDRQFQRRGVASALCAAVLDRLRARGITVVHIGTGGDAFHAPARQLYESLGFTGLPIVDYTKAL